MYALELNSLVTYAETFEYMCSLKDNTSFTHKSHLYSVKISATTKPNDS